MFALVPDHIGDTVEISCMLGDDECGRLVRDHHTGGVDISALVENCSGVLGCPDRYVWRVLADSVLCAISTADVNCVITIIKAISKPIPKGSCK
jgi:hypothetical protein